MKVTIFKAIEKVFSERVQAYLANGYTFNARTMGGSQGEIAKVDLTDGEEIIRIRIEEDGHYDLDCVAIISEKFEMTDNEILWSGNGEEVEKIEYFQKYYWGDCYCDHYGKDEVLKKTEERMERKYCAAVPEIKNEKVKKAVLKKIRTYAGMKSCTLKDVTEIDRRLTTDGHIYYGITARGRYIAIHFMNTIQNH